MINISVNLNGAKYSIKTGPGLISSAGELVSGLIPGTKAAVITDSNVHGLYTCTLTESLMDAGFHTYVFVCPAREESKSPKVFLEIIAFLYENGFTQDDAVFALGGGMVCDLAGFAASAYRCGTRYVMVPTTITAQTVCTTAANACISTGNAENIIGAPYSPDLAICDTAALATLPETEKKNGVAEIIRYAAAAGEKLFAKLEKNRIINASVIAGCIRVRKSMLTGKDSSPVSIIKADFGNIPGISVNTESRGGALASGMSRIARACCISGLCSYETVSRLTDLLARYGLDTGAGCADALICENAYIGENTLMIPVIRKIGQTEIREFLPEDAVAFINQKTDESIPR